MSYHQGCNQQFMKEILTEGDRIQIQTYFNIGQYLREYDSINNYYLP